MRHQLYHLLVQRIQCLSRQADGTFFISPTPNQQHQVFRHCALYSPVLEWLDEETPFALPAVLIEFTPIKWRQQSQGVRDATIEVRLHIVARQAMPVSSSATVQSNASDFLALADGLHLCLHGFRQGPFSSFTNTMSETDHLLDELAHLIETYSTLATDVTAQRLPVTAQVSMEITGQ